MELSWSCLWLESNNNPLNSGCGSFIPTWYIHGNSSIGHIFWNSDRHRREGVHLHGRVSGQTPPKILERCLITLVFWINLYFILFSSISRIFLCLILSSFSHWSASRSQVVPRGTPSLPSTSRSESKSRVFSREKTFRKIGIIQKNI